MEKVVRGMATALTGGGTLSGWSRSCRYITRTSKAETGEVDYPPNLGPHCCLGLVQRSGHQALGRALSTCVGRKATPAGAAKDWK